MEQLDEIIFKAHSSEQVVNNWYLVMSIKESVIKTCSGWRGSKGIGDLNMFLEEVAPRRPRMMNWT